MSKSGGCVPFFRIVTGLRVSSVSDRTESLLTKTLLNPKPQVKPLNLLVFVHLYWWDCVRISSW